MVIYEGSPKATHFLNVDLEIYSKSDLQPIANALGKRARICYAGRNRQTYKAHLGLTKLTKTADAAIRGLCTLIETLPKPERDLWNTAKIRDLNIGVQAGAEPDSFELAIAAHTLKAAHELNARIVFTVYASRQATKAEAKGRSGPKKATRTAQGQ